MGGKPRVGASRPRVESILGILQETWGHARVELDYRNGYELLVATVLSAQSTDRMVNRVTPELFRRYPRPIDLASSDPDQLEQLIRSTGFFRQKANNLIKMAQSLVENHGGQIPLSMEEMVKLPGVARKTANVVLGSAFGIRSGIVVDTHVKRVTRRLGLTEESDPVKIERDLLEVVPKEQWIDFGHQLIWHGRRICFARKPACDRCPLAPHCPSAFKVG